MGVSDFVPKGFSVESERVSVPVTFPLPPTVEAPFLSLGNMYISRLQSALRWEGRLMNFTNLREVA